MKDHDNYEAQTELVVSLHFSFQMMRSYSNKLQNVARFLLN